MLVTKLFPEMRPRSSRFPPEWEKLEEGEENSVDLNFDKRERPTVLLRSRANLSFLQCNQLEVFKYCAKPASISITRLQLETFVDRDACLALGAAQIMCGESFTSSYRTDHLETANV